MKVLQICVLNTFLTVVVLCTRLHPVVACSSGCTCTTVPASDQDSAEEDTDPTQDNDDLVLAQTPKGRKVNCSNNPYRFRSIEDVSRMITIPLDTIYLDLSKNEITVLKKGSFSGLSYLQRLDLSGNQISLIEPGAFEGLAVLDRLDLSSNKLGSINASIFSGLSNLKKLVLSSNKLNTIPEGTFNELPLLRRLDFQSDYLRCDCHLQWIVKWSKDKKVKVKSSTTCAVPRELNGQSLKKLKRKDLHCDRPLELPMFEIMPGTNQIVFEGDKIPFVCRASIVDPKTEMFWLRHGVVVETNRSLGIFINTRKSADNTVMMHTLVLEDLKSPNGGEWLCLVSTPQGNVTKMVTLVVIDGNAPQCEKNTVKTNKGVYIWKETIAGVTKTLPCKLGDGQVTHHCDKNGKWGLFNNTACAFTNEITRKLQTLAADTNSSKILSDAKNLEKLVSSPFRNNEDPLSTINAEYVDLASLAIYRLSQHAALGDEIVKSVLFSASKIMNISTHILLDAQRQRKSLSRISQAVESIPQLLKDKAKYGWSSQFIIMETRSFPRKQFPGVHCSRLDLKLDLTLSRVVQTPTGFVFVCREPRNETNLSYSIRRPFNKLKKTNRKKSSSSEEVEDVPHAEALTYQTNFDKQQLTSILVPKSAVQRSTSTSTSDSNVTTTTQAPDDSPVNFQFIWYQNANLFLSTRNYKEDPALRGEKWNVISNVLSVSLSEPVVNLTEPIELSFEIPVTDKKLVPVYWDYTANSGYGDWRTDGCTLVDRARTLVTVYCDHLTAFAVLEGESGDESRMFQMMEIVVYIGSCICLLCLMAIIITYVSCFKFLNAPRKMKHSVINICISLLLLIIGFTMGVKRKDHEKACQIVGMLLHYLTMVTVFWFTITASNMMKKFKKTEKPPPPPIDYPMPLPPKPIIRFYLLAWGVPSIICGITAAISLDFYSEKDYCFLQWEPGLGAFIGPVGFLLLLTIVFFLRIQCIIKGSTGALLRLEETQELPVTDIEMTTNHDRIETQSMMSGVSGKTSISSVMDFERKPITQLRALAFALVLFLFSWTFGAITVARPFPIIPYQELVFSYLYGVFCAIFGLFMLIYFCLTRQDSRSSWKRFFLCDQQPVMYPANHVTVDPEPQVNGHITTGSGMDISKISSTVVTNHVNNVKNSDDEMSSINLVPSKTPSIIDSSQNNSINEVSAASFYNPRQNGVAKKFWDKKNKHNSKLLSKEMTKSLNMNGGTDSEFSGSERPRVAGQGYNSDGNAGKPRLQAGPLQTQGRVESDNQSSARSPVQPTAPPSYSSLMSPDYTAAMRAGSPQYVGHPTGHPDHVQGTNQAGETHPGSPNCSVLSYNSSQAVPHHVRTNSSSSLGMRNHASAFSVVPPRNNTLPRQGKQHSSHSSPSSPEREMPAQQLSVPSSGARTGDFDGSSQVSSGYSHHEHPRSPPPHPADLQYMSGGYTSPPNAGAFYKQYGMIDNQQRPMSPAQHSGRHRTNSGGYSSGNSEISRYRRKMEPNNFIQQVEQRIPQGVSINQPPYNPVNNNNHLLVNGGIGYNGITQIAHKPPISPVSDSDNNGSRVTFPDSDSQLHYKKQVRYNDSDHNSEPASQSHKVGRSRDSHKHSKHRGMTKQRSLDWDKQFKDKNPANIAPYAYVNHNYTDRVLQKLTNMALTEQIDPKSKAFWVPRSSRSYNHLVHKENARLCEDDSSTSSSDDDSLDNIWVLKKEKRSKKDKKKETSV